MVKTLNYQLTQTFRGFYNPRTLAMIICVIGLLLFLAIYHPVFFRGSNLINILNQSAMLAILALGMSVVMIAGGIDLSLPANMALAGIAGSLTMVSTDSVLIGCLTMIAVGLSIGAANGFAVAYLKMIPFVVTLAMMTVCGGMAVWMTNSVSIYNQPEKFFDLFLMRVYGLPVVVMIALCLGIIGQYLMSVTRFGRYVYAIGVNVAASRISRVPVRSVLFQTYLIAGAMAGLAAVVATARLGSASANVGNDNVVLDIVTACVIGGISIYGGVGRPIGAMLGAVFVILLGNVLNLVGISFYIGLVIKGTVIISFIALDRASAIQQK